MNDQEYFTRLLASTGSSVNGQLFHFVTLLAVAAFKSAFDDNPEKEAIKAALVDVWKAQVDERFNTEMAEYRIRSQDGVGEFMAAVGMMPKSTEIEQKFREQFERNEAIVRELMAKL